MKLDGEIQNICVNPLERWRDDQCKSLFAGVALPKKNQEEEEVCYHLTM